MSDSIYVTELPDRVHAHLSMTGSSAPIELRVHGGKNTNIDVFIGGLYLGMTERNWQTLFNAIQQVDIEAPPTRTVHISMDDANREAHVEVTA